MICLKIVLLPLYLCFHELTLFSLQNRKSILQRYNKLSVSNNVLYVFMKIQNEFKEYVYIYAACSFYAILIKCFTAPISYWLFLQVYIYDNDTIKSLGVWPENTLINRIKYFSRVFSSIILNQIYRNKTPMLERSL